MRAVVGLGNPGAAYAHTRHNLGFVVLDLLAQRWHTDFEAMGTVAQVGVGTFAGEPIALVKPQLFMNQSGTALAEVATSIDLSALIVVHDELDLGCGDVRVKHAGGTAGHRGLNSIVAVTGADFVRVRLGIGRPPRGVDVTSFVLSDFDEADQPPIAAAIQRAADAVECVLQEGEAVAMCRYNARPQIAKAALASDDGRVN